MTHIMMNTSVDLIMIVDPIDTISSKPVVYYHDKDGSNTFSNVKTSKGEVTVSAPTGDFVATVDGERLTGEVSFTVIQAKTPKNESSSWSIETRDAVHAADVADSDIPEMIRDLVY